MGFIKVNDQEGETHVLEAVEGSRVMELIRLHGLPIEAMCGGACACATCHVHVAPEWAERLHPARDDEEAMLDTLPATEPTSRLSCQLIWDRHLDGLEVTLAGEQRVMRGTFRSLPISTPPTSSLPAAASRPHRRCGCCARPGAHHGGRRSRDRRVARPCSTEGDRDRPRAFLAGDLDGQRLVYAATGDRVLDAVVSRAAQARGIPVNVVDVPELSTFITPAIVDRAPVTVAIGTEGAAPVLAREIKTKLESWLPANLGALARQSAVAALSGRRSVPDARARRRLWERLLQGPFRRAVLSGADAEAGRIFARRTGGPQQPGARPRRV